jgi:hypothetical protein
MAANDSKRSGRGRKIASRLAATFLALALFGACTGDNLFTGFALSRELGPDVTITAPQAGLSIPEGDSVLVTATVSSTQGVSAVNYTGELEAGGAAFTSVLVSLPNPQDTTVSRYLRRTGTTAGAARLIVEATDVLGARGADTISVVLGN